MTVYVWTDRRNPAVPRALIQRGDCTRDHCGQFSISISDGQVGLTGTGRKMKWTDLGRTCGQKRL